MDITKLCCQSSLEQTPHLQHIWAFFDTSFAITAAAEIFQDTIQQTLQGIPQVINISDDILIYGKTPEEHNANLLRVEEHNANLLRVLDVLKNQQLTINLSKNGTYQGQWLRGMRHGYGVRTSAPFGKASKFRATKAIRASLTSLKSSEGAGSEVDKRERRVDDTRGGFVLKMNSTEPSGRRKSLGSGNIKKGLLMGWKLKQRSASDLEKRVQSGSIRSTASSASWVSSDSAQSGMTNASIPSDSNASFVVEVRLLFKL
ncbi:MORN repeat [Popillia japonica]|uniref:MORN repeat n=1 Tax=Popillia japonica TaxID=7064 RepID=A0AAW1IVE2_POPJA